MKKLLLQTCCAPCMSYVYEKLKDSFDITVFFYNPNIHPADEYLKRLNELRSFSEKEGFKLITGDNDSKEWFKLTRDYRFYGEKSRRCWVCYRMRLEESFKKALELDMDIVSTVLSISPHKNAQMINRIGVELSSKYTLEFLEADFKKQDGFKKSIELSKKHNFYRQNYCGCIYSKNERERKSAWYNKFILENSSIKREELV